MELSRRAYSWQGFVHSTPLLLVHDIVTQHHVRQSSGNEDMLPLPKDMLSCVAKGAARSEVNTCAHLARFVRTARLERQRSEGQLNADV